MKGSQMRKLREAGKLEEMAAVAHFLDLYTTAGFSVHYRAAEAPKELDLKAIIYRTMAQVLRELPMMFAVPIVEEGEKTYFAQLPSIDLRETISFKSRQCARSNLVTGDDLELDALLQEQVNINFKSEREVLPVWRLIILYDFEDDHQFTANFMVHHAIADGASFQILHRSFQKHLQRQSSQQLAAGLEPEFVVVSREDDRIGQALESFHSLPIPEPDPEADSRQYDDWLGNGTEVPSVTGYKTFTLASPMVQAFAAECKKNKVPTPAGLNALITKMIYKQLPETTESMDVNIPVDIRADLPPEAVDGVMGNFFDAFRTRVLRSDFCEPGSSDLGDPWAAARKIQKDTRKYFARTVPSGEAYLNIAALKNVPDLQALLKSMIGGPRSESLELAYIGPHVPLQDEKSGNQLIWQTGKATVSRCAFALGACLQMTVVLHTEGMTIGFAFPRAAVGADVVENTIKDIRDYFNAII